MNTIICAVLLLITIDTKAGEMPTANMISNSVERNMEATSHFVVIGSFRTLYEAKEFVESSDITSVSWVYEVMVKGQRWYRVVYERCKTRAQAERILRYVRENFYERFDYGGWIWTYTSGSRVVYKGSCE